ncbi:MAG: hypothetical protein JNN17_14130 [Verrucomicrobiaceae bacterium]|nr:hypothetical protein [Verrucomicrobiaceae bacterium]
MKTYAKVILIAGCGLALSSCASNRVANPPVGQVNLSSQEYHQPGGNPVNVLQVVENNRELTWDTGPAMW